MLDSAPWPLVGASLSRLQPLSQGHAWQAHTIFADVEKILGRAAAQGRSEAGDAQGPEPAQEPTEHFYLGFSDPETEELERRTRHETPSTVGPGDSGGSRVGPEESDSRSQASVQSELTAGQHSHKTPELSSTGPGGDKGQSPVLSLSPEEDAALSPCPSWKGRPLLLDGPAGYLSRQGISGEGGSKGRGRRRIEPPGLWVAQLSKLISKDAPGSCEEAEPNTPAALGAAAEDPPGGLPLIPPDTLSAEPAQNASVGSSPGASPASEKRHPPGSPEPPKADGEPLGPVPCLESSSPSSLASDPCSQVLGEVNNFPWDRSSSPEFRRSLGPSGPGPPELHLDRFLASQLSQLQSCSDEQSESEDYSVDQRVYQHILQEVSIAPRLAGLVAGGSVRERWCHGLTSSLCGVAAECSGLSGEGEHEAVRAADRDARLPARGPELPAPPQGVALAPAGQEASRPARALPGGSPLRQGLVELSSSTGPAAEPGDWQPLDQVGSSESVVVREQVEGPLGCPIVGHPG